MPSDEPPSAVPSVGDAGTEECLVGPEGGPADLRRTWDPARRVLTEAAVSGPFVEVGTLKWRFRTDGQVIAYVGFSGVDGPAFQRDSRYDEQGNRIDFAASSPDVADVMTPSSSEPDQGYSTENEYDGEGRLLRSTTSEYGANQSGLPPLVSTFTEDNEGRCFEVDSGDYGTLTIGYNDAGRISTLEKRGGSLGFCTLFATTTFTYDDAGRLFTKTFTCMGGLSGPNNGGTSSETHTYHADGSETVETFDGLTDVSNESHRIITRSSECLAIDAEIGTPADARCRGAMQGW